MAKKRVSAPWGNRIVRTGTVPASDFLANEANWRIHPQAQQDALDKILGDVGFVTGVIVNLRSDKSWGANRGVETMIDGHARVGRALDRGEDTLVPVIYVDLTPDEERLVLATFDPIGEMAVADRAKQTELIASLPDDMRGLTDLIAADKRKAKKLVQFGAEDHYRVIVDCRDPDTRDALFERLSAEGLTCRTE